MTWTRFSLNDPPVDIRNRLIAACGDFGWGYRGDLPRFYKGYRGWVLGNGTVVSIWSKPQSRAIPSDAMEALKQIEEHCNEDRRLAGLPLLGPKTETYKGRKIEELPVHDC